MGRNGRPPLRLVRGGMEGTADGMPWVRVGSPEEDGDVDAVVLEEDTWLILSAKPKVTVPRDQPVRLFTELHGLEPLAPGTVLVQREEPLTLMAVIHDFGADPCCRTEWIETALDGILRFCRERRLRSLLLPLFGVRHGGVAPEISTRIITGILRRDASAPLHTVVVDAPPGAAAEVGRLLRAQTTEEGNEA